MEGHETEKKICVEEAPDGVEKKDCCDSVPAEESYCVPASVREDETQVELANDTKQDDDGGDYVAPLKKQNNFADFAEEEKWHEETECSEGPGYEEEVNPWSEELHNPVDASLCLSSSNLQSLNFLKPSSDLLLDAKGAKVVVAAVRLEAGALISTYKFFGANNEYHRAVDIFGNTLGSQTHTIETYKRTLIDNNQLSASIDSDLYLYPLSSIVTLPTGDKKFIVNAIDISAASVKYELIDPDGNIIKDIPSSAILYKRDHNPGAFNIYEKQTTLRYEIEQVKTSDVVETKQEVFIPAGIDIFSK